MNFKAALNQGAEVVSKRAAQSRSAINCTPDHFPVSGHISARPSGDHTPLGGVVRNL
jgi:hypothetical protein